MGVEMNSKLKKERMWELMYREGFKKFGRPESPKLIAVLDLIFEQGYTATDLGNEIRHLESLIHKMSKKKKDFGERINRQKAILDANIQKNITMICIMEWARKTLIGD